MIDWAALSEQVYNVIAVDPTGATVRTSVGNRVLQVKDLRPPEAPDTPFLAYREGAISQVDRETYLATYRWLIYAGQGAGTYDVNTIAQQIAEAYQAAVIQLSAGGVVGLVEVTGLTDPAPDAAFSGLTVRAQGVAVLTASS